MTPDTSLSENPMLDRRRASVPRWILVAGFVLGSAASALAQGPPRGLPDQLGAYGWADREVR
jgi:hypothetical protein